MAGRITACHARQRKCYTLQEERHTGEAVQDVGAAFCCRATRHGAAGCSADCVWVGKVW